MYRRWRLSRDQDVTFTSQRYVVFSHRKHGYNYSLYLSFCQMDILKDIIHLITVKGKSNLYIPLGNGVVFMKRNASRPCIQHFTRYRHQYFLFSEHSWRRYINNVHRRVISLIKYDRRRKDCQCSLANELNMSYRHSGSVSYVKTQRQHEAVDESDLRQGHERSESSEQ